MFFLAFYLLLVLLSFIFQKSRSSKVKPLIHEDTDNNEVMTVTEKTAMQNAENQSDGGSIGRIEPDYSSRVINLNNQSERDPLVNKNDLISNSFRPSSIMHEESNRPIMINTADNSGVGQRVFSAHGRPDLIPVPKMS